MLKTPIITTYPAMNAPSTISGRALWKISAIIAPAMPSHIVP